MQLVDRTHSNQQIFQSQIYYLMSRMRRLNVPRDPRDLQKLCSPQGRIPQSKLAARHKSQWETETVQVLSSDQEARLTDLLNWRQSTSMPVAKVKSYSIEQSAGYPKMCFIESESLPLKGHQLSSLETREIFSFLSQSLIGYRALCHQIGPLPVRLQNFGVNSRGDYKIDVPVSFILQGNTSSSDTSASVAIAQILRIFRGICSKQAARDFKELQARLREQSQISYSSVISMIKVLNEQKSRKGATSVKTKTNMNIVSSERVPSAKNMRNRFSQHSMFNKSYLTHSKKAYNLLSKSYKHPFFGSARQQRTFQSSEYIGVKQSARCGKYFRGNDKHRNHLDCLKLSNRISSGSLADEGNARARNNVEPTVNQFVIEEQTDSITHKQQAIVTGHNNTLRKLTRKSSITLYCPEELWSKQITEASSNPHKTQHFDPSSLFKSTTADNGIQVNDLKRMRDRYKKSETTVHSHNSNILSKGSSLNSTAKTLADLAQQDISREQIIDSHASTRDQKGDFYFTFGGLFSSPRLSKQAGDQEQLSPDREYENRCSNAFAIMQSPGGWITLTKLLNGAYAKELKESVYYGEQIKEKPLDMKLPKLGSMGRIISESIITASCDPNFDDSQ